MFAACIYHPQVSITFGKSHYQNKKQHKRHKQLPFFDIRTNLSNFIKVFQCTIKRRNLKRVDLGGVFHIQAQFPAKKIAFFREMFQLICSDDYIGMIPTTVVVLYCLVKP